MTKRDLASNSEKKRDKLWNKEFIKIFIIGLLLNVGMFMMNTLVPKYADSLGVSPAVIGIVTSVFAIAALAIRPVAGPSMDYFRKEKMLRILLFLLVVSLAGYGLSKGIPMIVATRILHGAACGVAIPLTLAMASNALPESKMAAGIGIFSLTQAFATALGPSLGLWLVDKIGYSFTFFALAALLLISVFATFGIKSDSPDKSDGFKIRLDRIFVPVLLVPVIMGVLNAVATASVGGFIILYGELRGVYNVGLYFTANAIALLLARMICGKLSDKHGIDKVMIPGMIVFIISFIMTGASKTLLMFLITGVVSAFGFGICGPLLMTMCMQLVPKRLRGAASNTNAMGLDIGLFLGGSLTGLIITGFQNATGSTVAGYSATYYCMIIPSTAALIVFLLNRKKLMQRLAAVRAENSAENAAENS
jgi:MFS family permease